MRFIEALAFAKNALSQAGVPSAEADAYWLLCHAAGVSKAELMTRMSLDLGLDEQAHESFLMLLKRRVKREPLQHIIGTAGFLDFEVRVGPGVFIPRPETESLVVLSLELIKDVESPKVLEVGSGSGVIPIAISRVRPDAEVIAVEASTEALPYLRQNLSDLAPSVSLRPGMFPDAAFDLVNQVDLLVSNPPYIPQHAIPLEPEVYLHDPELALYSGEDGLDVIRDLVAIGFDLLVPGGSIAIEHADSQSDAIVELLLAQGYQEVVAHKDLTGRFRLVSARK
ncbi:MAG: peptide chain release factor N(5)-glutamine methyltransferase [Actinomycetota bacterium]|jgi:release factor glutamine methyltransferase